MKSFSNLTQVLVQSLAQAFVQALIIALIIGACGVRVAPQATPSPMVNATDIQNTAVSEFVTMLAENVAIPTATIPPSATVTNTPAATATLPPMPTFGAPFTAIPGGN